MAMNMEAEQQRLTDIAVKKMEMVGEPTVIGAVVLEYQLANVVRRFYDGKILFANGVEKEVSFVPYKGVAIDEIFKISLNVVHHRLLRPWIVAFIPEIKEHVIAYDRFDSLDHWFATWKKQNLPITNPHAVPPSFIQNEITKLAESLEHLHSHDICHRALNMHESYVMSSGQIKIINMEYDQASMHISASKIEKVNDIRAFGDMLKTLLLKLEDPKIIWRECNSFLRSFKLNYDADRLIRVVINHPFNKVSEDRMHYTSKIHQEISSAMSSSYIALNNTAHSRYLCSVHLMRSGGWYRSGMSKVLHGVYCHKNPDVGGSNDKYNRSSLVYLVRFLRNVYQHYDQYGGNLEDVDMEIRTLWPGFLHRLYEAELGFDYMHNLRQHEVPLHRYMLMMDRNL